MRICTTVNPANGEPERRVLPMKYVLQDLTETKFKDAPVFVSDTGTSTAHSKEARRYERNQAIDIQNRSRGRYRALPEIAPLVEDHS